jgi:N-acetylneuraminic acid mutarotase
LIYAVGCKYPDDTARRCEVYDCGKNQWAEIGQLNQGRHYHTITVLEQRYLYVVGGRDSLTESPLESIERLDTYSQDHQWELLEIANKDNQWSARDTIGSFAISDSEMMIFGGDQGWISDCFKYSPKTNEIERLECSLKKPEEFFGAKPVHHNDKVYVVGCLDRDVHVYSGKQKKWFLLEKWFIDW